MQFKESIFINRPVEQVFAYVTDYSTHPLWADAVRVDILTPGPIGVGTRLYYVDKTMGREVGAESEITVYEPPHRLGYKIVTNMTAEAMQTFSAENGGTRFTWEYEAEPTGVMGLLKVAEPLLAPLARKTLRTAQKRLKDLLEAGQG